MTRAGALALAAIVAGAPQLLVPARAAPEQGQILRAAKPLPRVHRPMPPAGWASGRIIDGAPRAGPAPAPEAAPAPSPPHDAPKAKPARARAADAPAGPCEAEIARAARRWDIPTAVLHAVGLTETGRGGTLSPYALNIDGATFFPQDAQGALAKFAQARALGAKFIDMGCMQINHRFHGKAFASPAQMLEPARNVDYAARFLKQLRAREGSWTLAVARYNAGPNNNPGQKRYVCAVLGQLVRSGHGAWTDSARSFCANRP